MSQRSTIIAALVTRLQTITIANGYQIAIGTKVYRWRQSALPESGTPCILVNDTDIDRDCGVAINIARNNLTVIITGLLSGSATVTDAEKLELDIIKCLHGYETVGGTATLMRVDKSTIDIEQHENIGGGVRVNLIIEYDTARDSI